MKTTRYVLRLTFESPLLGSQGSADVMTRAQAKKAGLRLPQDEEALLPDRLDALTTGFHRDEAGVYLMDYQVKGFLKEAGKALNGKFKLPRNLRWKVDTLAFVTPRRVPLQFPSPGDPCTSGSALGELDYLERPLRRETAQGPRVALARSEMLPAGVFLDCELTVIQGEITERVLRELLDYGQFKGLGQWRGGGWGKFVYCLEKIRERPAAAKGKRAGAAPEPLAELRPAAAQPATGPNGRTVKALLR